MLLPLTLAALVAASDGPLAQGAQYRTILESYRRGDKDAAVAALTRMPIEDRYRAARESVGAELSPFRRGIVQAVLALHSELAFSAERSFTVCSGESKSFQLDYRRGTAHTIASDFPEFEYALVDALRDNLPEADDFLKAWYLTIIAHSLMFHPGAISCFEHAPRGIHRDAEMQLAFGAMHESEWWAVQSEGWTLEYVIKPRLETAERAYRPPSRRRPASTRRVSGWDACSRSRESPKRRSRCTVRSGRAWTPISPISPPCSKGTLTSNSETWPPPPPRMPPRAPFVPAHCRA